MTPSALSGLNRVMYLSAGFVCVGIGGVGVVLPGLPSTIFFIGAAACFTRSSPRLERWVLELPGVGPLVQDHRDGLGMPRRAKVVAIGTMWAFSAVAVVSVASTAFDVAVVVLALLGTATITWRVPTRERELERRRALREA